MSSSVIEVDEHVLEWIALIGVQQAATESLGMRLGSQLLELTSLFFNVCIYSLQSIHIVNVSYS